MSRLIHYHCSNCGKLTMKKERTSSFNCMFCGGLIMDMITTRIKMMEYLESLGIHNRYLVTFTKRQVYEGIGLKKPSLEFNSAWNYLANGAGEFMSYDKEIKEWVWL